jgi:ribosomal protein L37AE/L43A
MKAWLTQHEVPFDDFWTGKGKPTANVFIDDKAIQYKGNWKDIVKEVTQRKTSASLRCASCNFNMFWIPEKDLWSCAKCSNNKILERASLWIFSVKPQDTIKYTIGKKVVVSQLDSLVGKSDSRIWKTKAGHFVSEKSIEFCTPEISKPVSKEAWLEIPTPN